MQKTTISVVIGSFQPFHQGHRLLLEQIQKTSQHILVLIGSALRPRSEKNPFKWTERKQFIETALEPFKLKTNIACLPLIDTLYDAQAWANNVRMAVETYLDAHHLNMKNIKIALIGTNGRAAEQYLRCFPEFEVTDLSLTKAISSVDTQKMRTALFLDPAPKENLQALLGDFEAEQILTWMKQNPIEPAYITAEMTYNQTYRNRMAQAMEMLGYAIPANCADAIVIQNGHLLLIERAYAPGKNLYALPGGHLQQETAQQAVIRELVEETRLDIPRKMLEGRITKRQVFDHPERSERGWVRTEAFKIELIDGKKQEKVKGADDAKRAFWMPINRLTSEQMFEDHFDIIQALVPNVPFAYATALRNPSLYT